MPITTITSDFGWRDHYLAVIKGALLTQAPQLNIVDITHAIDNYDIVGAAYIFGNAWRSFPPGTVHLVSVNDFPGPDCRFVALAYQGHYFVGPDNGLFALVFGEPPEVVRELSFPSGSDFPLRDIYAEAVVHLALERPIGELGHPADGILQRITFQPVIGPSQIRGSVIHIDNYENAVVNISRELFRKVGGNRPFALYFKRHDPITTLCEHFHDVPIGEPLCRFNSAGLLEIAVNMGRAGTLLGLHLEDMVQIDFEGATAEDPAEG